MSQSPDWAVLLKEIDDIDTEYAIQGRLSMEQIDRLQDIQSEIQPYLFGGSQEGTDAATRVFHATDKLLGRRVGQDKITPEGDIEVFCGYCEDSFVGKTLEDAQVMRTEHEAEKHPNT